MISFTKQAFAAAASTLLIATGINGIGAPSASADTTLGNNAASIANANLGNGACSTNSAGGTGYYGSCSGEEWCADFAKWVWNQAGYTDISDISSGAWTFAHHGATHGTFHWVTDTGYTPQPGDAIVWRGNGYPLTSFTDPSQLGFDDVQHVSLVVSVSSRTLINDTGGNQRNIVNHSGPFNPTVQQTWGQQVIGYISPGAGTSTPAPPPSGFHVDIDANNAPAANAQSVTGAVHLTALASSQNYINYLNYNITGPGGYSKTIAGGGGANNYAETWNTAGLPNGAYRISVTANETDGANHGYGPVPFNVHQTSSRSTVIAPNGHMYIFARGTDNTLRMSSADVAGPGWIDKDAPTPGNVTIQGEPAVTVAPNGHMYIFARGTDNALHMWSSDLGTQGWIDNGVSLGGTIATDPAVTIAPNGHMYIFAGGTDNTLRMWSSDLGAVGWIDTNADTYGSIASNPTVTIGSNGVMYIFAGGTDRTLRMWSADFTTGWHDQGTSLGGSIGGPAEAVANNNHLYILAAGTDNTMRMWSSDLLGAGWVDQNSIVGGGSPTGDPTVTIAPNGHMYIFARSTANTLQMWSSDMAAVGWLDKGADLGGSIEGIPAANIGPNGHLYIFAGGTDNTLRMWSSDLGAIGWLDTNANVNGGMIL